MKKKNLLDYQTPLLEVFYSLPESDLLVVSTGEPYNDTDIYDNDDSHWVWE